MALLFPDDVADSTQRQARHWCFTLNNPTFPADQLPVLADERYVIWQLEVGANGTPHLQGYVEFSRPKRLGALRAALPRAHWGARRASREAARDYCQKEDTREEGPWERGDWGAGGQGKRSDLADACEVLKRQGLKAVAQQHPTAFVKFSRGLKQLEEILREEPRDEDFQPRFWQQCLLDHLLGEPDDRTIFWVTDLAGGRGKSRLARYLLSECNATQLEGRVADMAFAYNREPIVIFDITRAQAEASDHLYTFAEKLKNGVVTSTKYESGIKRFKPPHVVFFANVPPPVGKWTADRLIEVDLADPQLQDDEAAAVAAAEAMADANAPFF